MLFVGWQNSIRIVKRSCTRNPNGSLWSTPEKLRISKPVKPVAVPNRFCPIHIFTISMPEYRCRPSQENLNDVFQRGQSSTSHFAPGSNPGESLWVHVLLASSLPGRLWAKTTSFTIQEVHSPATELSSEADQATATVNTCRKLVSTCGLWECEQTDRHADRHTDIHTDIETCSSHHRNTSHTPATAAEAIIRDVMQWNIVSISCEDLPTHLR